MHPKNQNQHRVSQTYLKQFGYNHNDDWKVSVYRVGHPSTENLSISEFTADFNIFDAPFGDMEFRRNFEIQCGKIENFYPVIISNLQNQKQLTSKNIEVLCHFIASLLARSIPFTDFIQMILRNEQACNRFIEEISMFSENKEVLQTTLNLLPVDLQLNTILGSITAHLVEVLRNFSFLVLEKPTDIAWMTTDNPVVLDKKENFEWLISPDTEIYLPLSGDFCLFGFHHGANDKTNPIRNLRENKINKTRCAV
ncbi:DUF4238 domain-containing protein [Parapedobacter indicus]|uniref:DUF4238 domain-containing protein n=1 Tax=Parapedobacter indicus TaxID=1477437 RepID=A0A1I3JE23_9SPHI|nr:DUF4238 domain-containing protein [Parapedobacter indicus]PPL02473.1 uncharacterized protein DUF4238 [Parapedobacter indicus]SFI58208.1 Protein of unknown function [Parapedobacter indicus]